MPKTHTIRLRGPWQVACSNSANHVLADFRINIRQPEDWDSWIDQVESAEPVAAVAFSRNFNWPGHPEERIKLVIEGQRPNRLLLNGVEATFESAGSVHTAAVDGLLATHNRLCVDFAIATNEQHEGLIGGVTLSMKDLAR